MAHLCYILDTSRDFYFPGMYNKKFTCSARLALNQLCTFSTRAGILCQNFEIGTLSPPSNQTWDPLSSLSASHLLAPRDLPAPLPGFIDVAMILLGIQVEHKCSENNGMGRPYCRRLKYLV